MWLVASKVRGYFDLVTSWSEVQGVITACFPLNSCGESVATGDRTAFETRCYPPSSPTCLRVRCACETDLTKNVLSLCKSHHHKQRDGRLGYRRSHIASLG